jgi:hypothetical protein
MLYSRIRYKEESVTAVGEFLVVSFQSPYG